MINYLAIFKTSLFNFENASHIFTICIELATGDGIAES